MRTFIAIDITNIDKIFHIQDLIIKQYKFDSYYVKPIKKNNLHLTIAFLGEKNDIEIQEIIMNLKSLTFNPIDILFNKVGCFPNNSNPRVIWLGMDDRSSQKLNDLYNEISKLVEKGDRYRKESQNDHTKDKITYVPHLTIFRINPRYKVRRCFNPPLQIEVFNERIIQIKLKKSILTADGAIYTDLFTI